MIDSLTIFTKNGIVLYHYSQPQTKTILPSSGSGNSLSSYSNDKNTKDTSSSPSSDTISTEVIEVINAFISGTLLDHNRLSKVKQIKRTTLGATTTGNGKNGATSTSSSSVSATVVEWEEGTTEALQFSKDDDDNKKDWMAVALYPEVVLRHSSHLDSSKWIRYLLRSVMKEYALFYDSVQASSRSGSDVDGGKDGELFALPSPPDKTLFDATFRALLRRSETMGRRAQAGSAAAGRDVSESFNQMDENVDDIDENDNPALEEDEDEENDISADKDSNNDDGPVDVAAGIARLKERQRRKNNPNSTTATEGKASKKGKEKTVWHDGTAKVTKSALANLDRSKDQNKSSSALDGIDAAVAEDSRALAEARAAYLPSSGETPLWEEEDILDDYDDDDGKDDGDGEDGGSGGGWGSSLKGLFDQMSGNKVLTDSDLDGPLDDMQRMLTSKNVANDIAKEICDGVRTKLVGKKMQSFMRVKTAVRDALEASIEKILRPAHNRDVDLLRSVVTKREKGKGFFGSSKGKPTRPYVIVMIGINGVGKSTSLAKIAYYLKSNGCSPLLAACDTFRSGAVEQLNVHAKCLDVPLYHKGYAKDPSAVAKAAIDHAAQEGHDVVLVDTAGRMQNNVPLMKALSKLVVENDPDLVLFVCEALVGNDGMDQLFMFDKALRSGGHSRQIDGIVLTKFDTVSDKVGAALTMTHITGAPVVFVGTGQKYNHLKKLGAQSVIKSLFS